MTKLEGEKTQQTPADAKGLDALEVWLRANGGYSEKMIEFLRKLQIARAFKIMGNDTAAKENYGQFLSLWKDADPDIPIYKQAKAEYSQLLHDVTKVQ